MGEQGDERTRDGINYERLYEYRFRDIDQGARQAVWGEIGDFVWNRMGRPQRVLDPAGGRGEFLAAIDAPERWLVDMVAYQERSIDSAVKVVIGDVLDVELPEGHFDGVFLSNFLEHLPTPDAVAAVLTRMRSVLAPGGVIAVMGPNFKYCAREYFDCADHVLALTHVAIDEHLVAAGFEVTDVVPRFVPYSFRGHFPPSRTLTRLYLQYPILWPLAGRQFLVLGRTAQ
jgi:SAM-dependent methyltransferase